MRELCHRFRLRNGRRGARVDGRSSGSACTPPPSGGGRPARIVGDERGLSGRPHRGAVLAEQPHRPEPTGAPTPGTTPDGPVGSTAAGAPAQRRRPRTRLVVALAAAVLAADLASKIVVVATLAPGQDVRLLGGLLHLTELRNVGAAFSFAEGATVVFSLIAVAVAVVIVRTSRRLYSTAWAIALGLVLGGALGNLIDRLFRAPGFLRGGVVDFLSVFGPDGQVWPVFNLADSAIVCGGALGVLLTVRGVEFDGIRGRAAVAAQDGDAAARDR
jgi:signal peptidase II